MKMHADTTKHNVMVDNNSSKTNQYSDNTLSIKSILEVFEEEIHSLIEYSSFEYINAEMDIYFNMGNESFHKCQYVLNVEKHNFGTVILSRESQFNEEDIYKIERALCTFTINLYKVFNFVNTLVADQESLSVTPELVGIE